ncbi:MAG: hypothetical protein LH467_13485 [Gemmatimonadaceae bacterium]|nr:hypothetical protein [Gemmatimonadaceae bacterium]
MTLPLPQTTDTCRIQLSLFSVGVTYDSTYCDNPFSGARAHATPLMDK